MNPAERVRGLVRAGAVGPDEGRRLLAALGQADAAPTRSPAWLLVNPFDRFGGGVAASAGLVVGALGVWATRFGVRFDGFLDLHANRTHVASLRVALVEQLVSWLLPALLFWAYARTASRHARPIDFLGMAGLSRLPFVLAAVPIALLSPDVTRLPLQITPALLIIALLGVAALAWTVTLLYQGFKSASGLRGARLVVGFVTMALASEVASKLVLALTS
jgi:Yip1 domain